MNTKTNHFYEFGPFRFHPEEHTLVRDGEAVSLPPRVIETLSLLLQNAGHLVEKDRLINEVWKDAIVEEGNLNKNIFILRKALGQWEGREYIETVPKRGYRFVEAVTETTSESLRPAVASTVTIPMHKIRLGWAAVFVTVLAVAVLIWFLLRAAPPRVNAINRITHDGFPIGAMVTDGTRIYFNQYRPDGSVLAQVSISGGETSIIPTPSPNMWIADISADHSQLLMGSAVPASGSFEVPLWAMPVTPGSPRRLGNIVAESASWSPDGQQMAFVKGSDLYLAKADGTSPHLLVSPPGYPNFGSFSPDGLRIRFTVLSEARTLSLWEVRTDGSNLHPLLPNWHNPSGECCGRWTADGRYYVFQSMSEKKSNIFALAESSKFLPKLITPVQLTNGPLVYSSVLPDLTGGKIFVSGSQDRGELVRYDVATKQFVPFLDGISATDLSFSRDGKWVVYVSIPDDILWRSRVDGRERIQLTYPPAFPFFPRWSPDGTRIAYTLMDLGKLWKIFLVSSQGGSPEELLTEKLSQVDPTWSPDGTQLAFGRDADTSGETADIRLVELNTRQITVLPGSKGLFSPRWSPDGRYIAAVSIEGSKTLWLYDVRAQKWSPWFTDQDGLTNNQWSADSRYIYYDTLIYNDTASANPSCRRIKVGEHRPEQLFSLKNLRRYIRGYEPWSGQAPDDSRIFLREESTEDIYALDVGLP